VTLCCYEYLLTMERRMLDSILIANRVNNSNESKRLAPQGNRSINTMVQ